MSLRDIERVMEVMVWFYKHGDGQLFGMMDKGRDAEERDMPVEDEDEDEDDYDEEVNNVKTEYIIILY